MVVRWYLQYNILKVLGGERGVGEMFKGDFSSIFAYISVTVNPTENLSIYKIKVDKISYKKGPIHVSRRSDTFKVVG